MRIGTFKAERLGGTDPSRGLAALCFLLAGIGAVALFSASWYFAGAVFGDPFRIWRRQLIWMAPGVLATLGIIRIPKAWICRAVPALVWIALILNLLTYIPQIGYSSGGARRWIEVFGFTFQPSEVTRVALVLYLARMLEKNGRRLHNFRDGLLPSLMVVGALVLTVYFQNDFSTAAYLFLLAFGMFFAAGLPRIAMGAAGVLALGAGAVMLTAKPYRISRLQSWFRPEADPSGAGYQLIKARAALMNGGFWGRGLGRGELKQGGLPAAHSDFVMAVVGEEAGLIGVAVVLILFTLFALKGWSTAASIDQPFAKWAVFGLVGSIYWQALMNFSVVSGLLPATGIPLPLFSAGGSAAFTTLVMFGLIMNLAGGSK